MAGLKDLPRVLQRAQQLMRREYISLINVLAERIGSILLSYANEEGIISLQDREAALQEIGDEVLGIFTAGNSRTVFGADGVTALATYPRILNRALAQVQYGVFLAHHEQMKRDLPEDIFAWLENAQEREPLVTEITEEEVMRRAALRALFMDTSNLGYDPAHTFVGPDGYTLSDRIWRVAQRTREELDQALTNGIRDGRGAVKMAKDVERMLKPGQALPRTTGRRVIRTRGRREVQRLYWGRRVSYNAMRLARTEITASYGRASIASAEINPFVTKVQWVLSPSHPVADICDQYHMRKYDPRGVPDYPPHPHCLCTLRPVTRKKDEVTRELREIMEEGRENLQPYMNPANIQGYTNYLLGDLTQYIPQISSSLLSP